MKTVLFVVHGFPPMGGAGVQRTVKFIKHLGEFGWQSGVLTAETDPRDLALPDATLAEDLPAGLPVYRSHCPDPFVIYRRLGGRAKLGSATFSESRQSSGITGALARLVSGLMVPDMKVLWVPGALMDARKVFARHRIDAIVSSSPWETVHLIAARLRALHRAAWLADFRDPWTQASWNPHHPASLDAINRRLERMVLRRAHGVMVTSRTTADGLVAAHGRFPGCADLARRIHVVYNGYDEADFDGVSPKQFERFTIVYSGRAIMPGRSPEPLLAGVAELHRRRPDFVGKIQIVFVGAPSGQADALVAAHGLTGVVRFAGYLPHRESLSWVRGADMLYLNTIPECIPGKFPEYLQAARPILGIMQPDCEVAGLIREHHAGVVVGMEDRAGIARAIESQLEAGREAHPAPGPPEFSRRFVTGQLAELLTQAVRRHGKGCVNR